LKQLVEDLYNNLGVITFTDVNISSTAANSQWIIELENAVYNEKNTPQLVAAYELDDELYKFSERLAMKQIG